MGKKERVDVIQTLESYRKSKVIAYITGDRQGLVTQVGDDSVGLIQEHLEAFGKQKKISMFLYTRGGAMMTPLRIVNLIKEYCDTFEVMVPYRAQSAGSLLCLGADGIIMGKLAELTPVDPSTANDFNPQNPVNPMLRVPISVEDVTAYLSLAEMQAGLKSETTKLEVFKALTSQINPIALGNVRRVWSEIRALVEILLKLHMTGEKERTKIPGIVKALTETYTHDYQIPRKEAKKIGLKVEAPDEKLESIMMQLYRLYEKDLLLRDPFNADALLGNQPTAQFSHETAYIESTAKTHAFIQAGIVNKQSTPMQIQGLGGQVAIPGLEQVTVRLTTQKWQEI